MKKILALILALTLMLPLVSCGEKMGSGACEYKDSRDITGRDIKYAEICVKNYGKLVVLLDATTAPKTVENFVKLASEGFYDGLTFHRVVKDFMVQGGDPDGDGSGGSPDKIKGEFLSNGWKNDISHKKGVISMARSQTNDSASSQFFICTADSDFLDGDYAAFGYVVEGLSVMEEIEDYVWPRTAYYEYYGTYYHSTWANYGNGAVVEEKDKPVIKYIKILENY